MTVKELIRTTLRRFGYQVTRVRPPARFQGMSEALILLRSYNYVPRIVIDAGANNGSWTSLARSVFPEAHFYLIEPQPACASRLRARAAQTEGMTVHSVAVTEPGVSRVRVVGGGSAGDGTGARIAKHDENGSDEIECPATTLDELFAAKISPDSRCLCKLDLERHELAALKGATRLLQAIEVILSEVVFYDINGRGSAVFADLVQFLREHDFELYDFACLGARPRDMRLQMGDALFVRRDSPLMADSSWQ